MPHFNFDKMRPTTSPSTDDAFLLSHTECLALRGTLLDSEIGLRTRTHYHDFRAFPSTFTGLELCRWLINHDIVVDSSGAVIVGEQLLKMSYINGVVGGTAASLFSGSRGALYSFASIGGGLHRRRRETRVGKADSRVFSKSKWRGFISSKTRRKKRSLTQRIRALSQLFPAKIESTIQKKTKSGTHRTRVEPNSCAENVELEKLCNLKKGY